VHRWFAVVAIAGIVLAAVYVLWMVQRTIHGPVASAVEGLRDLSFREAWVIGPVILVIVFLGVNPKPLLDRINPSVERTNSVVRTHDPLPTALYACVPRDVGTTPDPYVSSPSVTFTTCPTGYVRAPGIGYAPPDFQTGSSNK
jgi:hypothetical protein